ncbi:hypothetical protein A2859_01535 [Candidatus Roizmanbacteria bacterium RIFCSPHIGHO2_01_FULL_37_16b]|nr:MAG: hypothetical protein A2859_01535 [Candidatus Roizmanbacteria bacterium RIFCSPHIGHO2_01_FULL_37_16b]
MIKKTLLIIFGLGCGIVSTIFILQYYAKLLPGSDRFLTPLGLQKPEVVGFIPYWLLGKDNQDFSPYLDTVSYFGLTVDADGTIEKFTKPDETEPGWLALKSEKINSILDSAKKNNLKRSLVLFSGNQEKINRLMENPEKHAQNLVREVSPILTKYGFTDLNIDIESVSTATDSARQNFILFTKTIHDRLKKRNGSISLSIDVSPTALIKKYLIDIAKISTFVDKVILMTYDFHYQGSSVTGAVAPVNGAGISAEFDTETSIKEALKILAPEKIILGVPLYGYEWETLSDYQQAAVIPGSGIVASNKRVEDFLAKCSSCSAKYDPVSLESYIIYKDQETNTFHQLFYPDKQVMQEKINLMKKYRLGGIALWALGYEGKSILEPLKKL